jgi:UDP-N-acetylmuramate dehydrogenase
MTVTVEQNVPLAPFTTIGIGGPARFFARVTDVDALREAIAWSRDHSQPLFILGGGLAGTRRRGGGATYLIVAKFSV